MKTQPDMAHADFMATRKNGACSLPGVTVLCAMLFGTSLPARAQQTLQRTYKATAYVTVFAIPIFSRSDVGYGLATEERDTGPSDETIKLEFLGSSIPERAHGLNRFGYIQESVEEKQGASVHAHYIGLMTASREESLGEAKAALNATNTAAMACVAASGEMDTHFLHSIVWPLVVTPPKDRSVANVMRLVRSSLAVAPSAPTRKESTLPASGASTFLYSLRGAMLSKDTNSRHRFLYNAKSYVLRTDKRRDVSANTEMRRTGLTSTDAVVIRLNGTIENESTHSRTEFSVWYQEGSTSSLPLRFQLRPKSYLRLVFDAQPGASSSAAAPESFPTRAK